MKWTHKDRTIALSGVFQAAVLVQQIARKGRASSPYYEANIHALLKLDSSDVLDVFGGAGDMQLGLKTLREQLSGERNMEITRYVISMSHLERRLQGNKAMLERIAKGLSLAKNQASHFSETHENVIANLAQLYLDTLSTIRPPIMVHGDPSHLTAKGNAEKVRALLFSGLRACVLWRQLGGGRLQLFLARKHYLTEAQRLLAN